MDDDGQSPDWLTNRRELLAAASALGAAAGCLDLGGEEGNDSRFGFGNGLKIGQVTPGSAKLWTRLTRDVETPQRTQDRWKPPADGTVEMVVWPAGKPDDLRWIERAVRREDDAVAQARLTDLDPATTYRVLLVGHPDEGDASLEFAGSFRTAPDPDTVEPISFAVVSCQAWRYRDAGSSGFRAYETLDRMEPDFFVHTGDIVYYDQGGMLGRTIPKARAHWHRTYSLPFLREFHRSTPSYFLKDDHDIIDDDSWPGKRFGSVTFEDGVRIFNEQNPTGEIPYTTVRWGADLQIWLLEMREFRSPNTMPDGPEKTILGERQINWLKETVEGSDAPFKLIIAPIIFVGPDRGKKNDSYANKGFSTEGELLREYLADQDVIVLGGDRHWQYTSVHERTGLWEFGCGALAKGREGGWGDNDMRPQHRFLAVKPGFLWATVGREDGEPRLTIEHRTRHGDVRHSEQFTADPLEHAGSVEGET